MALHATGKSNPATALAQADGGLASGRASARSQPSYVIWPGRWIGCCPCSGRLSSSISRKAKSATPWGALHGGQHDRRLL